MERVQGFQQTIVVVIANGDTASAVIPFRGYAQAGFQIPSAFTGASVSFNVSADNVTYTPLHDSTNTVISQTVTASKGYSFPQGCFPWAYVKIVSASAEGGARSILVSLKY